MTSTIAGDQTPVVDSAGIDLLCQEIATLLPQTFSLVKGARQAAEERLSQLESSNKLYGLATLSLTHRRDLSQEVLISAAITFKNFIKRHWHVDPNNESNDQNDHIGPEQRELIKQNITKSMLESSSYVQRQLSEAITIIGQSDFPERWPNLILELEASLKSNHEENFNIIQGILQTAHSIFRRYRYELQSDRLWREIKLVIHHFAEPFTERFKELVLASKNPTNDREKLTAIYQSLLLCAKIYHSLITQDLPEFFEDRLNDWLPYFLELLSTEKKLLDFGTIDYMKSEICEIASLFVQRYSDAENLREYTQKFAQAIWNLLVTNEDNYMDTLVSSAIRYLITVAERPESRSLFQDPNVLDLLCQRVIIPNLTFGDFDEELFELNPDEYVKRDIEGSDVDTKRRAACDLVQVLSKFLEAQMIEIFGRYIEEMFKTYESDREKNWRLKDLAIFLYSAMAIKGSTRQHGTISISQHVNVEKFLEDKIIEELVDQSDRAGLNILKADALRYITMFRNQISLQTLVGRLHLVVKLMTADNVVVRTYAAYTLDKLLTMRDPAQQNQTAIKPEQFEPFLGELIGTLFDAVDMEDSPQNEHIMKAIMRFFSFSKSHLLVQFLPQVVPKLTNKLGVVAKNPSNPYFNHFLFETLALTIRAACSQESPAMRDEFENVLFNILNFVLANDVQEFTPYVLQLLNLILQAYRVGSVSDKFTNLFQELLSPSLWEKAANVTPLSSLMQSYIEKVAQFIISQNKLIPILGVFQKLIASKATDHEALSLLQTMMIHLPTIELDARMGEVFMLIFQRLSGSKTPKFTRNVLVCFSLYVHLRGADVLATGVNQLQDKIFGMVLEKLYIVDAKKVTGYIERRICMCGMIKILAQLPLIDNGAYNHLWAPFLMVLMEMFELPPEVVAKDEDHFADIAETLDFQAQYSKLNYASRCRDDPTKEVGDLKVLLALSLANLSAKLPGFVPKTLQDNLDQNVVSCLMNYCKAANVSIA